MIERRWRAVEADIQRWYGVDARTCGARRLLSLVQGLPAGSRALGGNGWLVDQELLASLLEVSVNTWSKRRRGRVPYRVPRPEAEPADPAQPQPKARQRILDIYRQLVGR